MLYRSTLTCRRIQPSLWALFLLLLLSSSVHAQSFSHKPNGVNLQNRNGRIAFIPENSKLKVRLDNGREVNGRLTGADSNSIYISRHVNGKQVIIANNSIRRITVFNDHEYFTLIGGTLDMFDGCGSEGCDVVGAAVVLGLVITITAGELIVDGIADLANDEHYDLVNTWKVSGPVVGR
jgi:hypothetical protein